MNQFSEQNLSVKILSSSVNMNSLLPNLISISCQLFAQRNYLSFYDSLIQIFNAETLILTLLAGPSNKERPHCDANL